MQSLQLAHSFAPCTFYHTCFLVSIPRSTLHTPVPTQAIIKACDHRRRAWRPRIIPRPKIFSNSSFQTSCKISQVHSPSTAISPTPNHQPVRPGRGIRKGMAHSPIPDVERNEKESSTMQMQPLSHSKHIYKQRKPTIKTSRHPMMNLNVNVIEPEPCSRSSCKHQHFLPDSSVQW